MWYIFAFCCEISIAEVWLHFNFVRKCRSVIAELCSASAESKSSLQKLHCASKIKNKNSRFALWF